TPTLSSMEIVVPEWLGQILDELEDPLGLLRRRRHGDARFRHGPRSIDAAIGRIQADLDEPAPLIPACCQQHFLVVRLARLLRNGRAGGVGDFDCRTFMLDKARYAVEDRLSLV